MEATERRVEQQVLGAIANGLFDAHKGTGAPLSVEESPFEAPEWRLPLLLQRRPRELRRNMKRFNFITPRAAARPELQVKPVVKQFDRCRPGPRPR